MDGVAVDRDRADHDLTLLVFLRHGWLDAFGAALNRFRIGVARIVHPEGDVAHPVAVPQHVGRDRSVRTQRTREDESDLVLLDEVARAVAHARLGSAVADQLKAECRLVLVGRLLRVADVELDVVGAVDREDVVRFFLRGKRC